MYSKTVRFVNKHPAPPALVGSRLWPGWWCVVWRSRTRGVETVCLGEIWRTRLGGGGGGGSGFSAFPDPYLHCLVPLSYLQLYLPPPSALLVLSCLGTGVSMLATCLSCVQECRVYLLGWFAVNRHLNSLPVKLHEKPARYLYIYTDVTLGGKLLWRNLQFPAEIRRACKLTHRFELETFGSYVVYRPVGVKIFTTIKRRTTHFVT